MRPARSGPNKREPVERFEEQAIVVSTVDYGDADRLVTLFTRGRGKLTAFAAGARKSKRRFAGALEPFTVIRAQLCERRGDTFRIDGADIDAAFDSVRQDLSLIARAMYCLELCRELVRDREPHPQLYLLLLGYLELLDRKAAGPTSLIAFELDALAHGGLMPRFDPCALCAGPTGDHPRFDPEHGGVICDGCAHRVVHADRVDPEVVRALKELQRGARVPLPAPIRKRARELLNLFIAHQLGRRLNTVDFMAQVGLD
jgi:DNA repair protein RecO (recombination protein O)